MTVSALTANPGGFSYWNLGRETDPDILLPRLEALGLPAFAPEHRSWLMSLKAALSETFSQSEDMVRPLKSRSNDGYLVVTEERGRDNNTYVKKVHAKVDEAGSVVVVSGECNVFDLQRKTNHFRHVLASEAVSKTLVAIATGHCKGIGLREAGGLYFIPDEHVGLWMRVLRAVEDSAVGNSKNRCSLIPLEINEMTMRDIREAIVKEICNTADHIMDDLRDNELGERAIENRAARAKVAVGRMKQYEALLGETLTQCRESLRAASTALSAAVSIQDANDAFDEMYEEVA